jgi:hypothetical protein
MPANTAVPGLPRSRSDRNSSDGDLAQAEPGHLEHADLVGGAEAVLHRAQHAELLRAFALERQHCVHHVLDHAGAGDLAVLGDVADEDEGGARLLGEADQRLRRGADLGHGARRGLHRVGPHGLDRVDHHEARRGALRQRGDDVLHRGLGGELHRGVGEAEALGAQPHLRHRLLAGDIDRAMAGPRQQAGGLGQQGRFADARIAADQQHRAADEAAAGDAVELRHAGGQARRVGARAGQRLELEQPALALGAQVGGHGPAAGVLLGQRVPLAAALAFALPAVMGRAAVLADEGDECGARHGCRPENVLLLFVISAGKSIEIRSGA